MISFAMETHAERDTIALGERLGEILQPSDVVLLIGGLGTGKTRLAKGIISRATGVNPDEVVSPTFTLINVFPGRFPIAHADLYRLERVDAVEIGLDEALEGDGALVVEWAERIPEWAADPLTIRLSHGPEENTRRFVFQCQAGGSWEQRMRELAAQASAIPREMI